MIHERLIRGGNIVYDLPSLGMTPLNQGYPHGMTTEEKNLAMNGRLTPAKARRLVAKRRCGKIGYRW